MEEMRLNLGLDGEYYHNRQSKMKQLSLSEQKLCYDAVMSYRDNNGNSKEIERVLGYFQGAVDFYARTTKEYTSDI